LSKIEQDLARFSKFVQEQDLERLILIMILRVEQDHYFERFSKIGQDFPRSKIS